MTAKMDVISEFSSALKLKGHNHLSIRVGQLSCDSSHTLVPLLEAWGESIGGRGMIINAIKGVYFMF